MSHGRQPSRDDPGISRFAPGRSRVAPGISRLAPGTSRVANGSSRPKDIVPGVPGPPSHPSKLSPLSKSHKRICLTSCLLEIIESGDVVNEECPRIVLNRCAETGYTL